MTNEHTHDHGQASGTETCPVMHVPVDPKVAESKGLVREYKGKKYYFCCNMCPPQFDADPEKYTKQ